MSVVAAVGLHLIALLSCRRCAGCGCAAGRAAMASAKGVGIPIKLMHEAEGHVLTVCAPSHASTP